MNIVKRDGSIVPFEKNKIITAINCAFLEVDGVLYEDDTAKDIADEIYNYFITLETIPTVEDVQNMVEDALMISERRDVAREYVRYRYKHEVAREKKDEFFKAITEKLMASNIENSNANVDEASFGGRIGEATNVLMKRYALDNCMSKKSRQNHENNEIYIHDLNSYAVGNHNCLSIPFDHLLAEGFNTRQTSVRPAQSINTAFQLIAVIFQLQSLQQFGGVSATHLDWTMVPYVRKSFRKHWNDGVDLFKMPDSFKENEDRPINEYMDEDDCEDIYFYAMKQTRKEIYQAVEGLLHNLNTLQSRSGNQLPFTSINYGTCDLIEGRMITKALLETTINGIGKNHKTSIFPCQIFQMKSGINRTPKDPNYDLYQLALKCTAKRLYPNYANCDWSGNAGYDENDKRTWFSTMGL